MGAADQAKPRQTKMIVKVFVSCLLACVAASSESSSSESGSGEFRGPGLYFSPIEVDLACTAGSPLGAKLASAFETCLGGVEALNPSRLERSPLRGGGGGQTRGGSVQLLSRSRPGWDREWKVTGVFSHSWVGSTRMETRTTRLPLLT